jgi:hypothetical protein
MFKIGMYDANVYKKYDRHFYKCKSFKERNDLIELFIKYGVTVSKNYIFPINYVVSKDYKNISDYYSYLVISKQSLTVFLHDSCTNEIDERLYKRCTLKEFINLFRIKKKYTIYGRKIC